MRTTSLDQSYALGVKEMLGQELLPAHAHTIGSYLLVGHVITLRGCLQLEGHWEKNHPLILVAMSQFDFFAVQEVCAASQE